MCEASKAFPITRITWKIWAQKCSMKKIQKKKFASPADAIKNIYQNRKKAG